MKVRANSTARSSRASRAARASDADADPHRAQPPWRLIAAGCFMTVALLWVFFLFSAMQLSPCQEQLEAAQREIADLQRQLSAALLAPPPLGGSGGEEQGFLAPGAAEAIEAFRAAPPDAQPPLRQVGPPPPQESRATVGVAAGNCLPKSTSTEDEGYADEFRGWYDVQGCGYCYDYCRWVGDSGPGGDPRRRQQVGLSRWSCRLAGTSAPFSPSFDTVAWRHALCSGEGALAPPPLQALDLAAEDRARQQQLQQAGDQTRNLRGNPPQPAQQPLEYQPGRPVGSPITEVDLKQAAAEDAIGVVVVVCKRPNYLLRTMESVLSARQDAKRLPLVISQDNFDAAMSRMVQTMYVETGIAFHMNHPHDPKAPDIARTFGGTAKTSQSFIGYVRIAQHYGFVLERMIDTFGFNQVIILEEDMEISPDFFSYFSAMLPILRTDQDLFCVSAWNDNGYSNLVQNPKEAFRTDFFPGLGWMMHRKVWEEVRGRWPKGFWDEFMRTPAVRQSRQCIRPDISRSFTFGSLGTSSGQYYKTHLSRIKLNDVNVDWEHEDISYLETTPAYDAHLRAELRNAQRVNLKDLDGKGAAGPVRILYEDKTEYKDIAKRFNLMPDEKEGVRRMSYRGVIPFSWEGRRVYLYTSKWPDALL